MGETPYCLWGRDIQKITSQFLESVDPDYFEYVSDINTNSSTEEQLDYASLSLRMAYSQGLETLFAFLGAAIQGPHVVPAWLDIYRDLAALVEGISRRRPVESFLESRCPSWQDVSEFIHLPLVLDDKVKEERIKTSFGRLWSRFAGDFLDAGFRKEYNSMKHGLRVRSGGFFVALGPEKEPGRRARGEDMRLMGQSEFGSSYYGVERLDEKNHLLLRRHHRNWDPEDLGYGLHLIAMSLRNIVSRLKEINGAPAQSVKFAWPSSEDDFEKPWERSLQIGIESMSVNANPIPRQLVKPWSRDEILAAYRERDFGGWLRYRFESEEAES